MDKNTHHTTMLYTCENCGKEYDINDGILAEIEDNKVVTKSCGPHTKLTELCYVCVDKILVEQ